jgi:peptidyl-prolyl cis-trans isomerase C
MRLLFPLAVFSTLSVCAQTQAPSPAVVDKVKTEAQAAAQDAKPENKPAAPPVKGPMRTYQVQIPAAAVVPIAALPPDTVIATVDGEKVTAGELQAVLRNVPPQAQQMAQSNRRLFVEQYGMLRRLSKEAREEKLDQQSPWKEVLAYAQLTILYQAAINRHASEIKVPAEDVKKLYETKKENYLRAKVKAIYLPFNTAPVSQADSQGKPLPSEAEAKAKAEDLVKQIRGGGDFEKLAKEYSGDEKPDAKDSNTYIRKGDPLIPSDITKVLFAAKVGEVTAPVRQANRFCIFRVEEIGPQPFEEVQGAIAEQLKDQQMHTWFTELQKSLEIKMEYEVPSVAQPVPAPSTSSAPPQK